LNNNLIIKIKLLLLDNIKPYKVELCLLDALIGEQDVEHALFNLITTYPNVIKVLPLLLAIREKSIRILTDSQNFFYRDFDFSTKQLDPNKIKRTADWFMQCGLGELVANRKITSFLTYATGVEVGLDSNGRKNRTGTMMENIVEPFIQRAVAKHGGDYIAQATQAKIRQAWQIDINVDKTARRIDFVVNMRGRLYFIETNFYGGTGSKLKSTAGEYKDIAKFWAAQNFEFIWITDGEGWQSTRKPLREFFNQSPALLNLQCLQNGALDRVFG
jgi:type II restriction enzyme